MSFRTATLASEAVRNSTGSRVRTAILFLAAAGLTFAVSTAELQAVGRLVDFQRFSIANGKNVVVAASDSGDLPLATCVGLARHRGVRHAGGLRRESAQNIASAPGSLVQTGGATPGAISLWTNGGTSAATTSPGWFAASALAAEFKWRPGTLVRVGQQPLKPINAVFDPAPRNTTIGRWLVSVIPPAGTGHECWVEFDDGPAIDSRLALVTNTFSTSTDTDVTVRPLFRLDELARRPSQELRTRTTALAWLPAGVVIALLLAMVARSRWAEAGLYRVMGASSTDIVVMAAIEAWLVLLPANVLGTLWSVAGHLAVAEHHVSLDEIGFAIRATARATILAATLGPLAWIAYGRDSIAAQLKEH